MTDSLSVHNIYENIYRNSQLSIDHLTSKSQAEEVVRHLGHIYNTFGIIIKDLIKIVGSKFSQKPAEQKPAISNKTILKNSDKKEEKQKISERVEVDDDNYKKQKKVGNVLMNDSDISKSSVEEYPNKQDDDSSIDSFETKQYNKPKSKRDTASLKGQNQQRIEKGQTKLFSATFKKDQPSKKNPFLMNSQSNRPPTNFFTNPNQKSIFQSSKDVPIIIQSEKQKEDSFSNEDNKKVAQKLRSENRQPKDYGGIFINLYENDKKDDGLRMVPGRKKKERQEFMGITCMDCNKYYKAMGLQTLCNCTSRHRSNLPMTVFTKKNFSQQLDLD